MVKLNRYTGLNGHFNKLNEFATPKTIRSANLYRLKHKVKKHILWELEG